MGARRASGGKASGQGGWPVGGQATGGGGATTACERLRRKSEERDKKDGWICVINRVVFVCYISFIGSSGGQQKLDPETPAMAAGGLLGRIFSSARLWPMKIVPVFVGRHLGPMKLSVPFVGRS